MVTTANLTLIATTIIAFISVIYTWIFSRIQMVHNKNSVRPLCEIVFTNYINKISIKIINNGTGPLMITDCKYKNTETGDIHNQIITSSDGTKRELVLYDLMPKISYTHFTVITQEVIKRVNDCYKFRLRNNPSIFPQTHNIQPHVNTQTLQATSENLYFPKNHVPKTV
ncbi:MAG: hypothetical protein FWH37_01605 [Candidatus Bathyarchaeota archaeon]|nr:hypothetical protein [Candidatus Termiticorpusculum sp.]